MEGGKKGRRWDYILHSDALYIPPLPIFQFQIKRRKDKMSVLLFAGDLKTFYYSKDETKKKKVIGIEAKVFFFLS